MKQPTRTQLKVRLEGELDGAVRRHCAAQNVTQTALVQAALQQYLTQSSPYEALMLRLDRINRQLEQQRRVQHLVAEALGAFVLLWLGHTPAISEESLELARRTAQARYRKWADHVAQRLTGADSFFLQFATPTDRAELDAARQNQGALKSEKDDCARATESLGRG